MPKKIIFLKFDKLFKNNLIEYNKNILLLKNFIAEIKFYYNFYKLK